MHDCDVMICGRRALRRPHHRPPRRLLAGIPRRSTSISIRQSINKNVKVDLGIIGDCGHVLEDMVRCGAVAAQGRREALGGWWKPIDGGARATASPSVRRRRAIKPQHAIQRAV
jgi:acetolactate synthase-1/2/3 large subunit